METQNRMKKKVWNPYAQLGRAFSLLQSWNWQTTRRAAVISWWQWNRRWKVNATQPSPNQEIENAHEPRTGNKISPTF